MLSQYGIQYLYHITAIDNLSSILDIGLVSHYQAHFQQLIRKDISDPNVQLLRYQKKLRGIPLQEYVPLYFNPKNPMLFVRKNQQSQLAILAIDPFVLTLPHTAFSDGNAACSETNFYWDFPNITKLNWTIIRKQTWHDELDGKRIKCAEVLVYNHIPVNRIWKIFCYSKITVEYVKQTILKNLSIPIEVNRHLYF